MFLFLVSFIAGVLTVLAPCVLPLLPVIVGGSLAQGNARRAFVICSSLGISVLAFTLFLKASTVFINVPQGAWQLFSGTILVAFGFIMFFPQLWDGLRFVNILNRGSNQLLAAGYRRDSIVGDAIMGAALGPVFSSCSPTYFVILATVLPQSFAAGFADLLAYVLGLSGFLLVIALAGQRLVEKLGITIDPRGWFRRGVGVLFIAIGIAVATGAESGAEAWLLNRGFDVTAIEQRLLGASQSDARANANAATSTASLSLSEKAMLYPRAPELVMPDGYINTDGQPITIGQFKGKNVVLVDFWTYSCINCIRTIPYVETWYQKYKDAGLVVIGVHTPEFAFEHVFANVSRAVAQFGITYPVVQDNEYQTWNAFGNEYWPREYVVDIDGYIVHDHAGEGEYDQTEAAIQKALAERAVRLGLTMATSAGPAVPANAIAINFNGVRSPETYFGSNRNEYLGNGSQGRSGRQTLSIPGDLSPNTLYLGGAWDFEPEYARNAEAGAQIAYEYSSKNVYFVAASESGAPVTIKITLDGKPLDATNRGADVDANSEARVQVERLYELVHGVDYGTHVLRIMIENPGLRGYTVTFG